MCGRSSLACIDDLCGRFRLIDSTLGFRSHFNITPGCTNPVIMVHERAEAVMMQWGLVPHWSKDITATHSSRVSMTERLRIPDLPFFHHSCFLRADSHT